MINLTTVKRFCKDYTKIENYEEAVKDTTQTWQCHHILGEILSSEQLKDHDFYYDVPPCMLKFVTKAEHNRLHNKGKKRAPFTEEHRRKLSEAHKGKVFTEEHRRKMSVAHQNISDETRRKMSESQKGRTFSEESRRKLSEAHKGLNKGKTWKLIDGRRVWY